MYPLRCVYMNCIFLPSNKRAMENTEIIQVVSDITKQVSEQHGDFDKIHRLKMINAAKYRSFSSKYPKLFDMCWDPTFDHGQFAFLMSRMDDIRANRRTFEESTQDVCDSLNAKYIIPVVGEPTASNDEMPEFVFKKPK